jgi:hypothetical protein
MSLNDVNPLTILLPKYHDFVDVFARPAANTLSPHRLYNSKIVLEEEKLPPVCPLYNISQEELKALLLLFDKNFEKGFIRASTSPVASRVLFITKPNSDLHLCVDF